MSGAFPCLGLAREAAETGGTSPAVLNAANEVAVAAFLAGTLGFARIPEVVEAVLGRHERQAVTGLDVVLEADGWARAVAQSLLAGGGEVEGMTILGYLLAFLVAIGILVAVHEYGHFWMARRLGIRVIRFSIGFGRPLWRRLDSHGTEFAVSAIPLGGYVKLLDEREGPVADADRSRAFNRKPVWQRILVLLAGPFANFLFAVVAYWVVFVAGVPALKPVLGDVTPDSIAARAGLVPGDEIIAVGHRETGGREAVMLAMLDRLMEGGTIELEVRSKDGGSRVAPLRIEGSSLPLTEPGALLPGLGFEFWYPPMPARVGKILAGSPAERAGLRPDDLIVEVDGSAVADFPALVQRVQPAAGKTLDLTVERSGDRIVVPVEVEAEREGGRLIGRIGVQPAAPAAVPEDMRTRERYGPLAAVGKAVGKTWQMSALTVRLLWNVATGDVSARNLSGPINIAEYAGFSARQGILAFLSFLSVVSVSLFVLNLLPIPILDGGQILYQLAELAKGRPLSERAQAVGQQIGIALLLMLMSLAFYNDISRLSAEPSAMRFKYMAALPALLAVPALYAQDTMGDFTVGDIKVEGLQRISEGTVFNYLPVNIGDRMDAQRVEESLRALYATGFFKDVELRRDGGTPDRPGQGAAVDPELHHHRQQGHQD